MGTWQILTECDEYTNWVQQYFARDAELSSFLQSDVGVLTQEISRKRNRAAHDKPHTLAAAQEMRTALLETQDNKEKTLMEWCVNILDYNHKLDNK